MGEVCSVSFICVLFLSNSCTNLPHEWNMPIVRPFGASIPFVILSLGVIFEGLKRALVLSHQSSSCFKALQKVLRAGVNCILTTTNTLVLKILPGSLIPSSVKTGQESVSALPRCHAQKQGRV